MTDRAELRRLCDLLRWEESHIETVAGALPDLLDEFDRLEDTLQFMRGYWGFEARPCALCTYDNGRFVKRCSMHERIADLELRLQVAADANYEANKPSTAADRYRQFVALRDALVNDDICLSCGAHTPGTHCQCENDD